MISRIQWGEKFEGILTSNVEKYVKIIIPF